MCLSSFFRNLQHSEPYKTLEWLAFQIFWSSNLVIYSSISIFYSSFPWRVNAFGGIMSVFPSDSVFLRRLTQKKKEKDMSEI